MQIVCSVQDSIAQEQTLTMPCIHIAVSFSTTRHFETWSDELTISICIVIKIVTCCDWFIIFVIQNKWM